MRFSINQSSHGDSLVFYNATSHCTNIKEWKISLGDSRKSHLAYPTSHKSHLTYPTSHIPPHIPHLTYPTSHTSPRIPHHIHQRSPPPKPHLAYLTSILHLAYPTSHTSPHPPKVPSTQKRNLSFSEFRVFRFSFQSHLACSPLCKNNIFHLVWKNSPKSHETSPIPSIR